MHFSAENILKTSYCSQKDDYKWICLLETDEVHKKILYFLGRRLAYADKIENPFNAIADSIDRSKCCSSLPLSTNLSNLSQLTSSAFSFFAAPESTVFLLQLGILGYVPSFPFFFPSLLLQGKGKYWRHIVAEVPAGNIFLTCIIVIFWVFHLPFSSGSLTG